MIPEHLKLQAYRQRCGMTQQQAVDEIYRRAVARGDKPPGLCPVAVSRHENGVKHPCPYYVAMYCEIYRATPEQLGLAHPDESGHPQTVDRREFLTGVAGFAASLALPTPTRLGGTDIVSFRDSVTHLYRLDDLHGAGSVYNVTVSTFNRLRSLVEHASYGQATGRSLRELVGLTAEHAGWLAFDANRDDDAQRWWLEARKWSRLAESDSVTVVTMSAMAVQASDQHRPREVIDLATTARSTAGRSATPLLTSALVAREATGHAGQGDTRSTLAALRHARKLADRPHDDDPSWLAFYSPAVLASYECNIAMSLNDLGAAESAARTALALNDPVGYPRNHALCLTDLANVLVQRREMDEAAAVAKQATIATAGLDSARVTQALHAVTQSLAA